MPGFLGPDDHFCQSVQNGSFLSPFKAFSTRLLFDSPDVLLALRKYLISGRIFKCIKARCSQYMYPALWFTNRLSLSCCCWILLENRNLFCQSPIYVGAWHSHLLLYEIHRNSWNIYILHFSYFINPDELDSTSFKLLRNSDS